MKWIYKSAGISRQAFNQWCKRRRNEKLKTDTELVIELAKKIKKEYLPGMGVRNIYHFIRSNPDYDKQLVGWGKHSFEKLCFENSMRVVSTRHVPKTTIHGAFKFPNRIEGKVIYDINRIWVSDISYIFGSLGNLIGYATSLLDVYSRLLLGLSFSKTMKSRDTIIPALNQTFQIRVEKKYSSTYFHSDGGKQYIESRFLNKLKAKEITSSMARNCYENPFAESFNDVLKNHLLSDSNYINYNALKRKEKFLKYVYNYNKTHSGINGLTPIQFEKEIKSIQLNKRTGLAIVTID